jgi:hypothetical protein
VVLANDVIVEILKEMAFGGHTSVSKALRDLREHR